MKIRTAEDVAKLDARIKNELGVDVSQYRNEEVIENFTSLLVFPEFVMKWTIRPVLFALLFYGLGFFALDLVKLQYIIYAIIGGILFLSSGIFLGLLLLIWKMKKDIGGVMHYSMDILKLAAEDFKEVNSHVNDDNKREAYALLFKGIIHIVSIPILSEVLAGRIPIVGKFFGGLTKKILTRFSEKLDFESFNVEEEIVLDKKGSTAPSRISKTLTSASGGLNKILNTVFKVAQLPIFILFMLSVLLLFLFIQIIN